MLILEMDWDPSLREKNAQLINKLKQNQQRLRSRKRPSPAPVSPASPKRPKRPQVTPTEARQQLHSLTSRKRTFTSTPVTTPNKTDSRNTGKKTPQSILKKRQLIDRNVKVHSNLPDNTLDLTPEPSRRSDYLNFSYNASSVKSPYNLRKRSPKEKPKDASMSGPKPAFLKSFREENVEKLLEDDGNSRRIVNYDKDQTRRSAYLSPVESTKKNVNRVTFNESLSRTYSNLYDDQREQVPAPMLGYDWIAGALENAAPSAVDNTDEYFDDILTFRKQNKDMCVATPSGVDQRRGEEEPSDVTEGASTLLARDDHTCVHTYVVNQRLFAKPLNKTEDGQSACPVCRKPKKDPTSTSPGFVRVSLPAKHMEPAYKVLPHRRRSFDPSDSCALSEHCLAGMQNSRPSCLKPATGLDMRSAVSKGAKSKFVMDSDVDKIVREEKLHYQTPSRLTRARLAADDLKSQHDKISDGLDLKSEKLSGKENQKSGTGSRSVKGRVELSRKTRDLLNTSNGLRYHAQKLEKSFKTQPSITTRYPAGV